MNKYAWYTTQFSVINRYTGHINYARFDSRAKDGVNLMWLEDFYKPNMKGGHTHNHKRNAIIRDGWKCKSFRQHLYKWGL